MKLDTAFLRSKVARRIFILFICCAILPIAALALLSFSLVTRQLHEQSQRRLHQASKAVGMAIYERLLFLEAEVKRAGARAGADPAGFARLPSGAPGEDLTQRFSGLALVTGSGMQAPLVGRMPPLAALTAPEREYLVSGKTLLLTQFPAGRPARIVMARALAPGDAAGGFLLGEINPTSLWGTGEETSLPLLTELTVLDQSNRVLMSTLPVPPAFLAQAVSRPARSAAGQFEWKQGDREYVASTWSIFLQPRFLLPQWTVVLSESKADVLAPVADFQKTFPLVILMSLWVVLLLSISQIRRSLVPLERLQEGTRRIAERDFDRRVTVASGDEFEELAASFNTMAHRLGRQFNALTAMAEITQAILSALDTKKILDTVLTRMPDVFPCDAVGVALLESPAADAAQLTIADRTPVPGSPEETIRLTPQDVQHLRGHPVAVHRVDQDAPPYLAPFARRGITSAVVLPIVLQGDLSGIIMLGHLDPPALSQEDLVQARQVADQVAVALSNARLIEALDQLNWGTLTALARAIDAKSHWTAGHSERVTKLALKIGRLLGLSPKAMKVLHRGGLLHDIGKLGIPGSILDKAAKLTEEEDRTMREHAHIGARILEPISAYTEVLPIVLEHHERYDGTGYPHGLAGDAISLGGRIFAVADAFDALISDRPYRPGLHRARVIESIQEETGHQFDPKVVQAFLDVMAQEGQDVPAQATSAPPPLAS